MQETASFPVGSHHCDLCLLCLWNLAIMCSPPSAQKTKIRICSLITSTVLDLFISRKS